MTFGSQVKLNEIHYEFVKHNASELYEALEPRLNSHRVVLLDVPTLEQQLLGLVWKGGKINHLNGEHDDFANAAAGVIEQGSAVLQRIPI